MKYEITAAALLAAVAVSADSGCTTDSRGNWYCQQVNAISYTDVGKLSGSSTYNKISNMDSTSGACSSNPFAYSGPLSPLDEEVSLHFRGPLTLKQFAFYTPGSSASKVKRNTHERHHAHGHAHAHLHHARAPSPVVEERQLGATVTALIDGKLESWINDFDGAVNSVVSNVAGAWTTAVIDGKTVSWGGAGAAATATAAAVNAPAYTSSAAQSPAAAAYGAASSKSSTASAASYTSASSSTGGWTRQAYYDSASGTAEGLVFLNHNGGTNSGTFDYKFGNSLSYADSTGKTGASSPQVLADTTLASSDEVVIMSSSKCSADSESGDCGYYRNGTVAHHGFGGANKVFFFEFGMPSDGQTTDSPYSPVNMPAIWLLNAQIPRTVQYGPADCSCWTTGCGEFDIFEVLAPGDARCKSTLHGNVQGGDSNYFARPFTGTVKAVLIMNNNNMHIKVLDSSTNFGADLAETLLSDLVTDTMQLIAGVSLFALGA